MSAQKRPGCGGSAGTNRRALHAPDLAGDPQAHPGGTRHRACHDRPRRGAGPAGRRGRPAEHRGPDCLDGEDGRVPADLLGRGGRQDLARDRHLGHRHPACGRGRGRAWVERHRDRPGAAVGVARGAVPPRGAEGADDPAELPLPRQQRQPGRAQGGGGRVRAVDAVGVPGRGRDGGPGAGGLYAVPHERHRRAGGADASGLVPARPEPQLGLHADGDELPGKHRDGGRTHLRQPARRGRRRVRWGRRRLRGRRQRCRDRRRGHGPHAPLVRQASGTRRVHTARLRFPRRIRRHDIPGLLGPDRRADDAAVHPPPPPGEEGPERGDERTGRAHRLLPGPRHPGTDPLGAPRRSPVVEPGLRGCGVHRRLPGGDAPGRREQP